MGVIRGEPPLEMLHGNGYGGYGDGYGGYGVGNGDGDGYGGYGVGNGYGNGYGGYGYGGYGYGYGYGGYGYGNGGYGVGNGDGNGGYGVGNGDGNGDGDGGDGDGPELIYYWTKTLDAIVPQTKRDEASKSGAILAYWRSTKDGEPANGGRGTKASPGLVETTSGKLNICRNGFHATLSPPKWKGERIWVVALYPPLQFDKDKISSLRREFICEAPFKL